MRIAVAGGTGVVGSATVAALAAAGHETVTLARSRGVDVESGAGLDHALSGADAVVDATSIATLSRRRATSFFTAVAGNLARAARRAGAGQVVTLSIVGVDRAPVQYYAGKLAQERVASTSGIAWTLLRATQFHEFATQLYDRAVIGPVHLALPGRVRPLAVREVAARLAALAAGSPQGRVADLAGPREERLDDMMRRAARARGAHGALPTVALPGGQFAALRRGLALPQTGADIAVETFDAWLARTGGRLTPA